MPCETAIEFISGKPGGGKSFYSVKLIVDELIHGHRTIVTNEALKLDRLQEYLHQLGHRVQVSERVYLMSKEEVTTFYLRRSTELLLTVPAANAQGHVFMDWSSSQDDDKAAGGVFYLIAEAHNFFHPQFTKEFTPAHPMFQWASQHRKLKDRCFFQTQSIENVHVAVRRLAQSFHYIRNFRKETYRGFRRGDGFHRTTYLKFPVTETSVPVDEDDFRLDVQGLATCYETAGGVGVAGKGVADGGHKKKGLNIRWLWVAAGVGILVLVLLLFILPRLLTKTVVRSTLGVASEVQKTVVPAAAAAGPAIVGDRMQSVAAAPTLQPIVLADRPRSSEPVPFPTGIVARGDRFTIAMSDGTTRTEGDPSVTALARNRVVIDGRVMYFRANPAASSRDEGPASASLGDVRTADLSRSAPPHGQSGPVEASESPEQGPAIKADADMTPSQRFSPAPIVIDVRRLPANQQAKFPHLR
ncbi:MAG TPA: zonular occludens toxin domain-containing protein [Opitutaceae bacterium]|nr:zonular occludens toxin domain-containing protein [Opitutaceae bacterium]